MGMGVVQEYRVLQDILNPKPKPALQSSYLVVKETPNHIKERCLDRHKIRQQITKEKASLPQPKNPKHIGHGIRCTTPIFKQNPALRPDPDEK